ncbi:HNH endonuclease [Providencia alcalifaciens]|uniref:HNH endonuclease n=1 Tax=Providencia alcalifaciens TaxID=126385 RepID=UPI0002F3CA78
MAKRLAKGQCQLCLQPAPFKNTKGEPYLETHHIIWLSKGGDDTCENTVALCPNCHKKMHIVNNEEDIETLKNRSKELLEANNQ